MLEGLRNLLVIGLDVASLVSSAKNAGYNVFSVDYFGDLDVKKKCFLSLSVIAQKTNSSCNKLSLGFNPRDFLDLTKKLLDKCEVDGVLLSSGLEDHPEILLALNELAPLIGNDPRTISRVRDKENFITELKRIGLAYPMTELVNGIRDAKKKARDIGYPIVVKPEKSFGGFGLKKVSNSKKLEDVFNHISMNKKFLIQEYIEGVAASASVLSTASKAYTLTVNEQLLGKRNLGLWELFGYCGNIVPLEISTSVLAKCRDTAEKVINHYRLIGSNGVDFVITKEGIPTVIEVNPRFQGTLECVERVLGINLVKAHNEACVGVLPKTSEAKGFCVRLILYALKRSKIPALNSFKNIRDVPYMNVIIEKGEPLCSIIAEGVSRAISLQKANRLAASIYHSIK